MALANDVQDNTLTLYATDTYVAATTVGYTPTRVDVTNQSGGPITVTVVKDDIGGGAEVTLYNTSVPDGTVSSGVTLAGASAPYGKLKATGINGTTCTVVIQHDGTGY